MTTPPKMLYRVSEVAEMLKLPASTIQYWCYEFEDFLTPIRTKGGHRRFQKEDIETIRLIHTLMHDKVMSIEGAKKQLKQSKIPYRGFRCRSVEDALNLLREATEMVKDNPKTAAMIEAVEEWIRRTSS